jgi:hypothetical protein
MNVEDIKRRSDELNAKLRDPAIRKVERQQIAKELVHLNIREMLEKR